MKVFKVDGRQDLRSTIK